MELNGMGGAKANGLVVLLPGALGLGHACIHMLSGSPTYLLPFSIVGAYAIALGMLPFLAALRICGRLTRGYAATVCAVIAGISTSALNVFKDSRGEWDTLLTQFGFTVVVGREASLERIAMLSLNAAYFALLGAIGGWLAVSLLYPRRIQMTPASTN